MSPRGPEAIRRISRSIAFDLVDLAALSRAVYFGPSDSHITLAVLSTWTE